MGPMGSTPEMKSRPDPESILWVPEDIENVTLSVFVLLIFMLIS